MTVYANSARFDEGQKELTEDDLRALAPSIFATTKYPERSERFKPIATIDVLRRLKAEGFVPVGAKQRPVRNPSRKNFTKHLVRLRSIDGRQYQVGDSVFEMLLANANDGSASYDMMAGLFRILCLNSLVTADSTLHSMRVKHTGDVLDRVTKSLQDILSQAPAVMVAPDKWSKIKMTIKERVKFAEQALRIRFPEQDEIKDMPVTANAMLEPRRKEDVGDDLWRTYNVLQENLLRGGVKGVVQMTEGQQRRMSTREIKSIDAGVKANKQLWEAAAALAA